MVLILAVLLVIPVGTCRECEVFTESRGILTTPNFPGPYQVPLELCYVVRQDPDSNYIEQKTVIYFTQFYLRGGVAIETYRTFAGFGSPLNTGREIVYHPVATDQPTVLEVHARYVVLTVSSHSLAGANLRVLYNLMDVHGFNITYEVIPGNQTTRFGEHFSYNEYDGGSEEESCIHDHCRFNGLCFADATFASYWCHCFPGFHGQNCQYSERCSPNANPCNGGGCEHYIGGSTSVCLCPHGFTGKFCESKIIEHDCYRRGCVESELNLCLSNRQNNTRCECSAGNRLNGCQCETGWKHDGTTNTCKQAEKSWIQWAVAGLHDQKSLYGELLDLAFVRNVTILETAEWGSRYQLSVVRNHTASVLNALSKMKARLNASSPIVEDDLVISALVSNKDFLFLGTKEPIVLSCAFRAPEGFQLIWRKDGMRINVSTFPESLWIENGPRTSTGLYTSYLGLDRVQYIDKGLFTCELSHGDENRYRSLKVNMRLLPPGTVTPLAQSVEIGKRHELTCALRVLERVEYRWFKKIVRDESLYPIVGSHEHEVSRDVSRKGWIEVPSTGGLLTDPEFVEELYPAHSRLVIPAVTDYVVYQCEIETSSGTISVYAHVFPFDNSSKFCPLEKWMGITWKRTVVGAHDVQPCILPTGPARGEVVRKCLPPRDGDQLGRWEAPSYANCIFEGLSKILVKLRSSTRGYIPTSTAALLKEVHSYLKERKNKLMFGEGNAVLKLITDILTYESRSSRHLHYSASQINTAEDNLKLVFNLLSDTLSADHSVVDSSIFTKLHNIVSKALYLFLKNQPANTKFQFSNELLAIDAGVFDLCAPTEGSLSVYEAILPDYGISAYLTRPLEQLNGEKLIISLWTIRTLGVRYLKYMAWLLRYQNLHLVSKIAGFDAVIIGANESSMPYYTDQVFINFQYVPKATKSTLWCAQLKQEQKVVFSDIELKQIGLDEFSCLIHSVKALENFDRNRYDVSKTPMLIGLYQGPAPSLAPVGIHWSEKMFPVFCASAGIIFSLVCALSVAGCAASCWSFIKCVKLNVCLALLGMFITHIWESSASFKEDKPPMTGRAGLRATRQTFIIVVYGQQLLVALSVYAERLVTRSIRKNGQAHSLLHPSGGTKDQSRSMNQQSVPLVAAAPWLLAILVFGISHAAQQIWSTDSKSYWGTLKAQVSVPSAAFTAVCIIASMVYALILIEIFVTNEEARAPIWPRCVGAPVSPDDALSTHQQGLLKRSFFITLSLIVYSAVTSGYIDDPSDKLGAVTSVSLAVVVFLAYTAYCEVHVFQRAIWAHHQRNQDSKPIAMA